MTAIAKTDSLASVAKPDRDNDTVLKEVRRRSPAVLIVLSGKSRVSPSDLGLTQRQLHVLALVMHGKSNKAICRVLNLAEPTVKNHVTAILRALNVSNRTEAVIAVGKLGWELSTAAES